MSKPILTDSYAHELCTFFQDRLDVPNVPPSLLTTQLKAFAARWTGLSITPDVRQRTISSLLDISAILRGSKTDQTFAARLAELSSAAIFPVSKEDQREERVFLTSLNRCYIPDNTGRFANIFNGKVPLLDAGEDLPKLKSLLSSDVFKPHAKPIEDYVESSSVRKGKAVREPMESTNVAKKVDFVHR